MEKLSGLCDWLLVNKEGSAVWGLWGANYRREWERIINDWIPEGASTEREKRGRKQTRAGQSTPLLIASNQKDLLISHRKLFSALRHIKSLDINRSIAPISVFALQSSTWGGFAVGHLHALIHAEVNKSEGPIAVKPLPVRMLLMMCAE